MSTLRRPELVCGLASGVLGLVGVLLGWILPVSSSEGHAIANGHPLPTIYHSTSLADFLGTPSALNVLVTFGVLAVWVGLAAYLHTRRGGTGWLSLLWTGVVLFFVAALLGWVVFAYLFALPALLGLVSAGLGTLRQRMLHQAMTTH